MRPWLFVRILCRQDMEEFLPPAPCPAQFPRDQMGYASRRTQSVRRKVLVISRPVAERRLPNRQRRRRDLVSAGRNRMRVGRGRFPELRVELPIASYGNRQIAV